MSAVALTATAGRSPYGTPGPADAARGRPEGHGDEADRGQERMRQRAAVSVMLGVRRDADGGDADGHQDHPPGQRRRPER